MMITDDNDDLVIVDPNKFNALGNLSDYLNWIDAKERPPEIGWIVKRWKNASGGWAMWAGFYCGSVKMASCDQWLPLPE